MCGENRVGVTSYTSYLLPSKYFRRGFAAPITGPFTGDDGVLHPLDARNG
jgi:hypothetical protein